jgi:WD40 repeat protein
MSCCNKAHNASTDNPAWANRDHASAQEEVCAVVFFKDGQWIITSSKDKTLQIWVVETRALAGDPFEGHTVEL